MSTFLVFLISGLLIYGASQLPEQCIGADCDDGDWRDWEDEDWEVDE